MSVHTPTASTLTRVSQVQPNTLMKPVQPTYPHPSTDTRNDVGGPLDLSPSGARSVQTSPVVKTTPQVTITPLKTPGVRLMRMAEGIRSTPLQSPAKMMSPQLQGHATPDNVVFTSNPPPSNQADSKWARRQRSRSGDRGHRKPKSTAWQRSMEWLNQKTQSQKAMQHRR